MARLLRRLVLKFVTTRDPTARTYKDAAPTPITDDAISSPPAMVMAAFTARCDRERN
jgi:hypothetical protein